MAWEGSESFIDAVIRKAIRERRLIRLECGGKGRIVEPHDYGIQNGSVRLLAYQIGGASSGKLPGWRWFDVTQISDVELLNRRFPGGRPIASGKHHKWDELFLRVEPAS